MTAGATYTSIASTTLSSTASSVTFSSISGAYTDLVLVISARAASGNYHTLKINSDSGSNYSRTWIYGDGTSASSGRQSNASFIYLVTEVIPSAASTFDTVITNINNYSNATTYKTIMSRGNNSADQTGATVALWRSTSAITTLLIATDAGGNYQIGSTFSLYGITAA